jgi:hypothetical protein
MWLAPTVMGFYTAVITYLARDEVPGSALDHTRAAAYMLAVLFALFLVSLAVFSPVGLNGALLAVSGLCAAIFVRGRVLFTPLLSSASGPTIGRAIGGGILLMPLIDATLVAAAGHFIPALVTAAFILPAAVLKRRFYMT